MNARDQILGRLRKAQATTLPPPQLAASADIPEPDRVERLKANLEGAHGEVIDARLGDWRNVLTALCAAKGIHRLMLAPNVPACDLGEAIAVERFDRPLEALKEHLFLGIDAGLTVADGALAATGMLVLASSPAQPRALSLVPPIHICLLDAGHIHTDLAAALAAEAWGSTLPTNLIFISGPSKTADIQQTLAYGAHGPKQLIVILAAPGSLA
jgi:L-lactate dehydrogenase complex protein LldG